MRHGLALALLVACGPRETTPVDYGPPPQPVDPIACPAARLEKLAARIGASIAIATEPVVDTSRTDRVPCKPDEPDADCIARARKRPVPSGYEVTRVAIGGDIAHVEFEYDIDGRRVTERAETMEKMVARLKALQAGGHKVTLIRGESAPDAGSRHAAIAFRGVGGRERRVATLHARSDDPGELMADVQALARADVLELRSLHVDANDDVVIVVTCI